MLLAGFLGVILGAAVVSKPLLVGAVFALALAGVCVYAALRYPEITFGGLILAMALIPSYAAPKVGSLIFMPAAAAAWLIAIALSWRNVVVKGFIARITIVDIAALAFGILMTMSLAFSLRASFSDYKGLFFLWAGPYLAARLLLSDVKHPVKVVAVSFAIATAILAPIAIAEALGASNPFFNLNFNSEEFSVWASQINRFGQIRAVTSFGHPIAFSMFLAASALLSIAMGISSQKRNWRYLWYAFAAVAIGVQALALSRTGWLMIATGVIAIALVSVRGPIRRRLMTLFAITVGVVLVTSIVLPHELQVLPGVGHASEASYQTSGLYRQALLHRALEPGILHLWGNPVNRVTPAVNSEFGTATDNAYIILADMWGLLPTFALFGVGVALLITTARSYGQIEEPIAILPIVAFTGLVAIFFVAFITQQQVMIWLLIGAGGAAAERITASRRRQARRRDQRRSNARDGR
ncbi:MAG: O-antigen ligase family protein [Mycobacteriales bacterium]